MKRWRGFCAACRKDLYSDPARHYVSDSHLTNAKRAYGMEHDPEKVIEDTGNMVLFAAKGDSK